MKKRLLVLLACVVVLVVLCLAFYFIKQNNTAKQIDDAASDTTSDQSLLVGDKNSVTSMSITSANGTMSFTQHVSEVMPSEEPAASDSSPSPIPSPTPTTQYIWTVDGYEDYPMDQSKISAIAEAMCNLDYISVVTNTPTNLENYGLNPPQATGTITYSSGTTDTVYLGNEATDSSQGFYAMVDDDPTLYTISDTAGYAFSYTMNDVIDKSLPSINTSELYSFSEKQQGQQDIVLKHDGDMDDAQSEYDQNSSITLTMQEPFPGREVYVSNLQDPVLKNLSSISLDDLVELNPTDLSQYGLSDPQMQIEIQDLENTFELSVGTDAPTKDTNKDGVANSDDKQEVYVQKAGMPCVFTMDKSDLENFYNIDVFDFIDKFVSLEQIQNVSEIKITAPDNNFDMLTNKVELPADSDGTENYELHPTVNGQQVTEDAFKNYYQMLIGITYDDIIPQGYAPTSSPTVTIEYDHIDGTPPTVDEYYDYNPSFYAVYSGSDQTYLAVSKDSVDLMFTTLDDLLAGKLDTQE